MDNHWTNDSGSSALNRGQDINISAFRKHGPTNWIKTKASLRRQTLIKRVRLAAEENPPTSKEDVVLRRVKRKAGRDLKGPQEKKRRRLDLIMFDFRESAYCFSKYINISTSEESSASGKHGPTSEIKRKTSLIWETFIKSARLAEMETPPTSEEDVVIRGVKRKAGRDRKGPQEKKRRRLDLLTFDNESPSTSSDTENSNTSVKNVSRRGGKRKADDEDGPDVKKRRVDLKETKEETKEETKKDTKKKAKKETKKETKEEKQALLVLEAKAKFEAKYEQEEKLGEGACGSVFGGYRKEDDLPVAIKHIPKDNVLCKHKDNNGKQISVEVAVMLKLAAKSKGPSAPVALLDWYDLDQELILVMERPMPATDLFEYINCNGGSLDEEEAKVILRQLVDAAIDLEKKHIFHRDIKVENILIETSSDVPRVRLIDFGLSCFVKKGSSYRIFCGTHIPPEWYDCGVYRAGPTTAFEMGVVLFDTLHNGLSFDTEMFYREEQRIDDKLSKNCKQFLSACLNEDPDQRLTLEQLRDHPWLR